ncbi:putative small auxin-up RNA [Helianthus annuus]|nr:putative small auxin-up RNA [Helianthus annuus]
MVQLKIVKAWLKKRHTNGVVAWLRCEKWCPWAIRWTSSSIYDDDDDYIPRDVPKGHLVVYVGENERRFVISVKLLKDPCSRHCWIKLEKSTTSLLVPDSISPATRTLSSVWFIVTEDLVFASEFQRPFFSFIFENSCIKACRFNARSVEKPEFLGISNFTCRPTHEDDEDAFQ